MLVLRSAPLALLKPSPCRNAGAKETRGSKLGWSNPAWLVRLPSTTLPLADKTSSGECKRKNQGKSTSSKELAAKFYFSTGRHRIVLQASCSNFWTHPPSTPRRTTTQSNQRSSRRPRKTAKTGQRVVSK